VLPRLRYRARINSDDSEIFMPTRGLRQEDPLSPYLFILCTEGLTALLAKAEAQEELVGVKVCRDAPAISNLLFANESLILMQADEANAGCLKRILDEYCLASVNGSYGHLEGGVNRCYSNFNSFSI
jgi:hypothetical protein